ncbi:MAG TPA: DsbA family protein [Methyloceanibacter sp.]|nr:DsbA family protein [Methyloceanibacter sp.]
MPSTGLIAKLALLAVSSLALGYVVATWSQGKRAEKAVAAHAEQIFRSSADPILGNPQGDVSVVAFFDYNCPDCRRTGPALTELTAKDPKVRVVLKELPVLGADSEAAARVALAARKQGKYAELHERLLTERGRADKDNALRIAAELGLDPAALERDMNDPAITDIILGNMRLARDLGVRGVPFYIVGDRMLGEGADPFYPELAAKVAGVREEAAAQPID